jgi:hypothetical protein
MDGTSAHFVSDILASRGVSWLRVLLMSYVIASSTVVASMEMPAFRGARLDDPDGVGHLLPAPLRSELLQVQEVLGDPAPSCRLMFEYSNTHLSPTTEHGHGDEEV